MNWHRSSLHDRNRQAIKEGDHVWNSGGRCTRCFESTTAETLSLKCPGKASVPDAFAYSVAQLAAAWRVSARHVYDLCARAFRDLASLIASTTSR